MAERKNRHLVEIAHTLLLHHTVPQRFWGDAILTAYYLLNRMHSSVLGDQVPHSLLFPNQTLFCLPSHVFGCTCFVHILTPGQDKFSAKATKCIFFGYSHLQRGYRCYSPDTHRYFVSTDVTFFEHSSLFSTPPPSSPEVLSLLLIIPIPSLSYESPATPPRPLQVYTCRPLTDSKSPDDSSLMAPSSTSQVLSSPTNPPITIRKGTRSSRNVHPIYTFLSYHHLSSPYSAFISTLSSISLPHTVHEALSHPGWKQAMVEEIVVLHSTGTWDIVPLLAGKSPVGCRWVYTVKIGPDGRGDRLKACLVTKGYTQIYGSAYYDTFSLVAKMTSIRLLLSMVAMSSWPLYQLDIKNAFLHDDLRTVHL